MRLLAFSSSALPVLSMMVLGMSGLPLGSSAQAASFDCAKAALPVEKAICGDSELSKMDEDLAASYAQARAALSPEGDTFLRDGQRSWLGFVRKVCSGLPQQVDPATAPATDQADTPNTLPECLKSEYRERLEDLQQASERHGPFLFSRVDTFALAKSDPALPSGRPGFAYQRISWPRIDKMDGGTPDGGAAWNRAVAALGRKLGSPDGGDAAAAAKGGTADDSLDDTDLDVSYSFGLVTRELISLQMGVFEFAHGAAHPNGTSQMQNLFVADGRPLRPADLFRGDKDWAAYLARRSHDGWRKILADDQDTGNGDAGNGDNGNGTPVDEPAIDDKAIATVVTDPQNWLLTEKGISINFPLYSIGPYVVGEQQVEFTWDELKPYLVDRLPFTRP